MDAIRNVWSFILYSTGGLYVFFLYLEITVWLLVVWLLGVSLIYSKALLTLWELLSLCVCMCVSIVCSFKSMDYLIWIPSPHRQCVSGFTLSKLPVCKGNVFNTLTSSLVSWLLSKCVRSMFGRKLCVCECVCFSKLCVCVSVSLLNQHCCVLSGSLFRTFRLHYLLKREEAISTAR